MRREAGLIVMGRGQLPPPVTRVDEPATENARQQVRPIWPAIAAMTA